MERFFYINLLLSTSTKQQKNGIERVILANVIWSFLGGFSLQEGTIISANNTNVSFLEFSSDEWFVFHIFALMTRAKS